MNCVTLLITTWPGERLRILFFNRSFHPDTASTGQLLTELCEDLVRDYDAEVAVIAGPVRGQPTRPERFGIFASRESYRGIRILRTRSSTFDKASFAGRACNYVTYFACALLAGWFAPPPHIVVTLTDPPVVGLAAWLRSRILRARFVLVCQDIFPQVALLLEGFRKGVLFRLLDRISRFLLQGADTIVAIGETMRDRLVSVKNASPEKIKVIHNWADCAAITPGSKTNAFAQTHKLENKFVVMHSGNVGLSQSLETLVEAAIHLQEYQDIMVVIVGEGTKKNLLEKRARDHSLNNILFLPYQPKEALSESFSTADVFVVSLKEGMAGFIVPSKVYGILAAGRPFIAATDPDCEAALIAEQNECGLVCAPGDAKGLAKNILALYMDRDLADRLGSHARLAASQYDRKAQVGKYAAMFKISKGGPA